MPIYEYECSACGHHEEVIQHFSDKPLSKCPECSGKMNKLISQSAFHLKGSGWYVTDYADKKKSPASSDKEPSKPADSETSKKKADKKDD
jgi:putative FmdB family regulatory protein